MTKHKLFVRKQWDAVPADPTTAVQWKAEIGRHPLMRSHITLRLTCIWDVEALLDIVVRIPFTRRRVCRSFRSYGGWLGTWLYGVLEDRYQAEQAQFEDDPMGRLSDYL